MPSQRCVARPLATALVAALMVSALGVGDARAAKKKTTRATAVSAQCTDFYAFANADWLKANPSPADGNAASVLGGMRETSLTRQRELLEAAMAAPQGHVQKLLGDFWASGIDEAAVEADGAKPIAPLLDRINAIRKSRDVPASIAALHQVGIPVAFNFSPDIDLQDLERHIGYFMQGGTGLPDPAYYTRTDAETRDLLGRYRNYIKQILALTGTPAAKLDAESQQVIEMETWLARASRPLADLSDPRANFAPVEVKSLAKSYRNLQLDAFLKAQGVRDDTVSMANPELFKQINDLITQAKPDQWKAYLRWRVGDAMAPYLAKPWRDAEFAFRGRILRGQDAPKARWLQVLDAINVAAGPMLGKEYAERYLGSDDKRRAEQVADQVRLALGKAINGSPWMSEPAKAEAAAKLEKLKIEVGTPRRDLDYSVQPMGRGSFGGNVLIASTWHHREEMKRIGKGNAPRRWNVLPQQPALTYDIAQNRLIVTAAALQAPIFDPSKGESSLFGAYGALVGHELNHGFDRTGRMVDARGEVRDWWTPADLSAWDAIATRLGNQYNGRTWPDAGGDKVQGNRVANDAMDDLTGLELSWNAWQASQPSSDKAARQAFFLAWSQLWGQRLSETEAKLRAASANQAPGQLRSNLPLANLPAFAEAYSCKPGQPMQLNDADQISLWR
ncbi:peptidase M13 [Pseudoxanthomonas kalamensis DSM 18571]|uniref:M13-type metalloendopeptidase n=1 Tax=Pseudoxanthomonas kalamensis TaxID=289483 RepID=UPI0013909CAF|nr:M13 family metallopeptidase [Pseudoxanthomonas kalamensis]KAF1710347.1 peptidase M13 [Pseudoxanthomonas kalamensis DSM 18571]